MSLLHTPKPPKPLGQVREVRKLNAKEIDEEERAERAAAIMAGRTRLSPGSSRRLVLVALERARLSPPDLASVTGQHINSVYRTLAALEMQQQAHVCRYRNGLQYALGPSPVQPTPDRGKVPKGQVATVLCALLSGPLTQPQVAAAVPPHVTAIQTSLKFLLRKGLISRSGARRYFVYALTDAGLALATYIAKLEEAYACS